jgi:putative nucleotidyltransferase with HDIG domain
MIPNERQIKTLWERYRLPAVKRVHVTLVARVAAFLAKRMIQSTQEPINMDVLRAAALLHDIDKAIPRLPGEQHPDTGVRILREEGMVEVADIVATHPLQSILDEKTAPKTWEEKLLYLSDKMVKYDIVGVDKRFALWNDEHLPADEQALLDASYPKVKALEQEVFNSLHLSLDDVVKLA